MKKRKIFAGGFLVLAGLMMAALVIIPSSWTPPTRNFYDDSEFALENKTGFYQLAGGEEVLVSWDAVRGLRFFDVQDQIEEGLNSLNLVPDSESGFSYHDSLLGGPGRVIFELDEFGRAHGFTQGLPGGGTRSAVKITNPQYSLHQIKYQNGDVPLVATVFVPEKEVLGIGIVMIPGSGTSDRNNLWYITQADFLARAGFAVLLPDKRGSGKSGGEWWTASFADFAGDTLAAVNALRDFEPSDVKKIGIMGLSQGGWIAPLAADGDADLAFVVNIVGAVTTVNEQLVHELSNDMGADHMPRALLLPFAHLNAIGVRNGRDEWWDKNGDFDPGPYWGKLTVPGLIIYGEADEFENVPVKRSLQIIEEINKEKAQPIKVLVYPDMGHGLFDPETGWVSYEYLAYLAEWIKMNAN